jgi:hypothetical protein
MGHAPRHFGLAGGKRPLGATAGPSTSESLKPLWYPRDTSRPGSALEQYGEAVGRLAAHAGVHALVDGERDGGAGVAQALRDGLHRHPVGNQQGGVGLAEGRAAGSPAAAPSSALRAPST